MSQTQAGCAICPGPAGDDELDRAEVWRDAHWRLSMSVRGETLGFAYLEPIRHIPYLADLDGPEASTFGPAIARATAALREATGAPLVYAYVFGGGIPHLHVHLAPNQPEGVLNTAIITGEVEERKLPSGRDRDHQPDPSDPSPRLKWAAVIDRVRELMARLMDRWVSLDVGETLIDESRIWAIWADVLDIPRLTFMAALGAAIARGGEYTRIFDEFGIDEPTWRARVPEVEERYGGFQEQDLYPDARRASMPWPGSATAWPWSPTSRPAAPPSCARSASTPRSSPCPTRWAWPSRTPPSSRGRWSWRAAPIPATSPTWGIASTTTSSRPRRPACAPSGCVAGRGA